MDLKPGSKLGRYEIRSLVGAGGMGEVYRAHDAKIGREVAIKVLPAAVSQDGDRLARFEQEAQAAGSLNHPNILAIYDIQTDDGVPYVVSELLEGETLREKLAGGPLFQRKALDYALQVAHGLGAAHEKGIVHRDLKPENIFVTTDGRVKILDFGLAKLLQPEGDSLDTDLPTRKLRTDPGTVIGTVSYMSPEQVRARPLDHRTDIFSFGVIFYEMLTGRRAFDGESTADLMSAILREEPPRLSTSNASISPALERVVEHCLEKSPDERFRSARDLAFAIEALSTTTAFSGETRFPSDAAHLASRPALFRGLGWAVAGVLLISTLALGYKLLTIPGNDNRPIRFTVEAPKGTIEIEFPALSSDGRTLAFVGSLEGKRYLFVRPLDQVESRVMPGTEEALFPFWSPDGKYVAFFDGKKLKKIDVVGATVQTLCDAPLGNGGVWSPDGSIVFGMYDKGIHRVSASGGSATQVVPVDRDNKEIDHAYPHLLPDGEHVLYLSWKGTPASSEIRAANLRTGETRLVIMNNSNAAYADGHLLFSRESTLMAQPFDTSTLTVSGEPFPVQESVTFNPSTSGTTFAASPNGVFVFKPGGGSRRQLTWFDRAGKAVGKLDPQAVYNDIAVSPDGKWAVTQRLDTERGDLWIFDTMRNVTSRFTLTNNGEDDPVWSRDSKHVYYTTGSDGARRIARKAAIGGGEEVLADVPAGYTSEGLDILPDGSAALVHTLGENGGADVWIVPINGSGAPFPFLNTDHSEYAAKFSHDGRWIAYVSNESGRAEVYVRSFPDDRIKRQVSVNGGGQPRWGRDGRELFYVDPNRQLMSVRILSSETMEFESPVALFRTTISGLFLPNRYDVSGDGQRILVNSATESNETAPLVVVLNWAPGRSR